jgi:hypothetical protein
VQRNAEDPVKQDPQRTKNNELSAIVKIEEETSSSTIIIPSVAAGPRLDRFRAELFRNASAPPAHNALQKCCSLLHLRTSWFGLRASGG